MNSPTEINAQKQRFFIKKPHFLMKKIQTKKIFSDFSYRMGFVFFATIGRQDEDYEMIRGVTASNTHRDYNFCIGAHEGYDVTILERVNTLSFPKKQTTKHRWIVAAIDLKTTHDVPHIFMSAHHHSEAFYATLFSVHNTLRRAPMNQIAQHSPYFTSAYTAYVAPDQAILLERLFTPEITSSIGEHFRTLALEISQKTLYICADNQVPTVGLLEVLLKNGVWLASNIDHGMQRIAAEDADLQ